MATKIVYNNGASYHYSIRKKAIEFMRDQEVLRYGYDVVEAMKIDTFYDSPMDNDDGESVLITRNINRDNQLFAEMVLGETDYMKSVGGPCANLRVTAVPDHIDWRVIEGPEMNEIVVVEPLACANDTETLKSE